MPRDKRRNCLRISSTKSQVEEKPCHSFQSWQSSRLIAKWPPPPLVNGYEFRQHCWTLQVWELVIIHIGLIRTSESVCSLCIDNHKFIPMKTFRLDYPMCFLLRVKTKSSERDGLRCYMSDEKEMGDLVLYCGLSLCICHWELLCLRDLLVRDDLRADWHSITFDTCGRGLWYILLFCGVCTEDLYFEIEAIPPYNNISSITMN